MTEVAWERGSCSLHTGENLSDVTHLVHGRVNVLKFYSGYVYSPYANSFQRKLDVDLGTYRWISRLPKQLYITLCGVAQYCFPWSDETIYNCN